jgi:uncharacterized membrane protein YkgB
MNERADNVSSEAGIARDWNREALVEECRTLCGKVMAQAAPWKTQLKLTLARCVDWLTHYHGDLLRYSLAIVFIWFGILKPFGLSPANALVARTVPWFSSAWFIPFLGLVEVAIGMGLMFRRFTAAALVLLFLQMAGTMLPLVTLVDICYTHFPYGLTLEGQYIIKNLVLISAAISVALSTRPFQAPHQASLRIVPDHHPATETWREGVTREAQ